MSNLHVTIRLWTTLKFLCFSLSLSLSHAVCAFLYTSHMHAPPVCLTCLPNTHHVHGGEAALARVYFLALQGPALIQLIDCMACDGQLAVHRKLLLQLLNAGYVIASASLQKIAARCAGFCFRFVMPCFVLVYVV
jgi:hypothetical protein